MNLNEKMNLIEKLCEYYSMGKSIYEIFADNLKSSPGTEIIVSPANLGDTVFIATLAKAYKEVHKVERLLLVAKNRQAEVAQHFEGVDETVGLDDLQMFCLRYYFTISRKFYENGIRYGHILCDIDITQPGVFYHVPPGFGGLHSYKSMDGKNT